MKSSFSIALACGLLCASVYAAETGTINIDAMGNPSLVEASPAKANKMQGNKFLAANKLKSGIVTLADGLQYKIITEGKGEKPNASDTVTVHYAGRLIDGTEFDSSFKRGEPISFPLNQV